MRGCPDAATSSYGLCRVGSGIVGLHQSPRRHRWSPLTSATVSEVTFTRYVAIGDSQTEGLWDGDDIVGLTGFADRLAAMLDSLNPGLMYANLAVRGKQVRDVLDDQLPQALAMRPDLITVCVGMNNVTRAGRSFDRALADLEQHLRPTRRIVGHRRSPRRSRTSRRIVPMGGCWRRGYAASTMSSAPPQTSRVRARRPVQRPRDGRARHMERRPHPRIHQGSHPLCAGGRGSARFAWRQP